MSFRPYSLPAFRFVCTLIGVLASLPVHSIVSMKSLHLGEPKEGFDGELELSLSGASGNTDKTDIAAGTRLEWRQAVHTNFLVAHYAYGEAFDTRNTDRSFLHLRHITQQTPVLAWEAFAQGESNELARLQFRGLLGGGVRLNLLDASETRAAFLGIGAMYVRETYTASTMGTIEENDRQWRSNLYLVAKYRIGAGVRLVNSLYYQPSLNDIGDYRLLDTFALHVDLTDTLALRLNAEVVHDSQPPANVRETDVTYRTGLSWSF